MHARPPRLDHLLMAEFLFVLDKFGYRGPQILDTGLSWYSPVTENAANRAPDQCATCEDPANWTNGSCVIHRILQSADCSDGCCTNEQGGILLDVANGVAL